MTAATPFASAFRLSTPARREDLQPLLRQLLLEERADLRILDRNDAVEHFDDRHLGAEVGVEARELDPDRAGADDQQLGRHFRRSHGVAVGPDALAVGLGERKVARPRAGSDDDVLGGKLGRLAVGAGHGELALRGDLPLAHVHGDLVLLHQVRDALIELLCDGAAARHDLGDVEAGLDRFETVGVGMLDLVEDLGRAQQRLGRDAAPVEADAAKVLALDDRGLEAELGRADRGHIAARPGAEHDDVVRFSHCSTSFAATSRGLSFSSSATNLKRPHATRVSVSPCRSREIASA